MQIKFHYLSMLNGGKGNPKPINCFTHKSRARLHNYSHRHRNHLHFTGQRPIDRHRDALNWAVCVTLQVHMYVTWLAIISCVHIFNLYWSSLHHILLFIGNSSWVFEFQFFFQSISLCGCSSISYRSTILYKNNVRLCKAKVQMRERQRRRTIQTI